MDTARETLLQPLVAPAPDPLTERVRATWTAGDFGRIAGTYAASAAAFVDRLAPFSAGERLLDVACGAGNVALPAARLGAHVSGLDIAPNLVQQARASAAAAGLSATFDVGDCEAMPYEDGAFDTLTSMFGVIFAARPERAAAELLRVCRPGGRIALANWTPDGFVGQMLRVTAQHVPPAPGATSPMTWGDEAVVRERLAAARVVAVRRRRAVLELRMSPVAAVAYFREWYGPTVRAFASLDETGRHALGDALVALWSAHNAATDGTTSVASEYLEVVAIR